VDRAAPTTTKSWTSDQLHFQAWLALPAASRDPRSQRQLAAMLEVHESTLSDWKKLPGFGDAVFDLAHTHLVHELVPVLHAQVKAAKNGSLPHAQWLFDLAGKWSLRPAPGDQGGAAGTLRIVIETVDDRSRPV
jgi:hypothetical protein